MDRYSVIHDKMPREFLLLQGSGCRWGRCTFCDYHTDKSDNAFELNKSILDKVTGVYGTIDIINSGSALELDERTIEYIKQVVREKNINTIWFEAHYMYRNKLAEFSTRFAPAKVKFRCGIESFCANQRERWNKGVPKNVTAADIARFFDGICLLCCTEDDTRERIIADIATAKRFFSYFSINIFCNNTTAVKRNEELAKWFEEDIYPIIKDDAQIEILIKNTDLGVG